MADKKGLFVSIEGPDGGGKSTHVKLLKEHLSQRYKVVSVREPGGTVLGERVREILLNDRSVTFGARAEALLFEAARAQIVDEVIVPAMEEGSAVVSDRFYDSTTAYQGYGFRLNVETLKTLKRVHMFATGSLRPDLTLFIDVPAEVGLQNVVNAGKKDKIESRDLEFHRRLSQGFREIARAEPDRVRVVPYVHGQIDEVQGLIREWVDGYISENRPYLLSR